MRRTPVPVFAILAFAFAALGGCAARGPGASPDFVYSYLDRYPLAGTAVDRIDVSAFRPSAGDNAQIARLARDFKRAGQGKIVIFVPQSGNAALASGNWVKQELVAQGVSPNRIQWDARALPANTVRVAFAGAGAPARWDCTNLNEDVQQREDETSWLNREPVNFGCAYQSNVRAQVEDPRDFARPRPEGMTDPVRAANAVRRLRTTGAAAAAPANPAGGLNAP